MRRGPVNINILAPKNSGPFKLTYKSKDGVFSEMAQIILNKIVLIYGDHFPK
jgi:hypothetical protein